MLDEPPSFGGGGMVSGPGIGPFEGTVGAGAFIWAGAPGVDPGMTDGDGRKGAG